MEVSDYMKIIRLNEKSTLYLVSTPIGNLSDMTFRAVKTLNEVDKIYAEDTRTSGVLLQHYKISTPCHSYHKYNEENRIETLIEDLRQGLNIALISDAGTPLISDPGESLVKTIIEEGFFVTHIPGPTAFVSGLILSGKTAHPFLFYGFLPSKTNERDKILKSLQILPFTLVFYEAPHRIKNTLSALNNCLGNRNVSVVKEITKFYETGYHFKLNDHLDFPEPKGEMVIIVEGFQDKQSFDISDLIEHIKLNIEDGLSEMEAIKKVAKSRKMKKNDVYMTFQKYKNELN